MNICAIQYKKLDEINAVIRDYTIYSTVVSKLRLPIPPAHNMKAVVGVYVMLAEYVTFGTKELSKNAYESMKEINDFLLGNHVILAGLYSQANSFNMIDEVKYCAKIYCMEKFIGESFILDNAVMEKALVEFGGYGQVKE